jgi:hypothetical protein
VASTRPGFQQQCPAVGITGIPIAVRIFKATWEAVRATLPKIDTAAIERKIEQDAAVNEKGILAARRVSRSGTPEAPQAQERLPLHHPGHEGKSA